MRLIDADEFTKQVAAMTIANNYPTEKVNAWCALIDAQPKAYDVDEVVEQLELLKRHDLNLADMMSDIQSNGLGRHFICLEDAIEIVKAGGVE